MTQKVLSSLQNPLVKQIRKLHRTKERHQQDLLLLEGTHLLEGAMGAGYNLASVCCTKSWQERYPQLWQFAINCSQRAETVTDEVLSAITTTANPDGVIATAQRRLSLPLQRQVINLGLVMERLQDPGNLSTIIRTAAAVGVDGLWLSGDSVDWDHPKVLRASVGEWFKVNKAVNDNLSEVVSFCQSQGTQVVATLPQAELTYWEVDWCQPSLILLGNEGAGLSKELLALADCQVKIPLGGGVESLNVAITAALILYEAQRQRRG